MKLLIIALSIAFAGCPCKKEPIVPIAKIIVDCIAQDRAKLDALGAELQPLLVANDWPAFEAKANGGGLEIGGCIAAELINRYLAPPPGNAAPPATQGQAARATMERLRTGWKGATFKTSQGTL